MRNYFRIAIYIIVLIGVSVTRADDKVSFFRAIAVDNVNAVSALMAAGMDPNTRSEQGQTALYMALREEAPRVTQALLANPALVVDATNAANETALMMACLRGNLEAAKALLVRGASLNREGWAPLHYAASGNHLAVATWLLEQGAALEAVSPNGTTPLMMASRYGSEEMAQLLLKKGANSKAVNDKQLNAAAFARLAGREELAKQLDAAAR